MKPIILITNKFEVDTIPFGVGRICTIRSNYCNSIREAGGTPLITALGDAEEYAQLADGILFTGSSSDISPNLYDQENQGSMCCDNELDEMEMKLFQAFYKLGKPILGICRGHQLINVALGGTIIQDIATQKPDAIPHRGESDTDNRFHAVTTQPGSVIGQLFGPEFVSNTYHHQAVDQLGKGLQATAVTEDGIVEALEHTSAPILSVQFHPERMIGQEDNGAANMLPLFRYFVDLCK